MGHPGQWKTIELISQEYWWPGITEFVKAYIQGCTTCQTTKIQPPTKVPIKPNEIPEGIWETIGSFKVTINQTIIMFIISFIIFQW